MGGGQTDRRREGGRDGRTDRRTDGQTERGREYKTGRETLFTRQRLKLDKIRQVKSKAARQL